MPLLQTFGQHTEAASWVLNYLLNKVERNIRSPLFSDMDLINDTIGLLISLVDIRHKYVLNVYNFNMYLKKYILLLFFKIYFLFVFQFNFKISRFIYTNMVHFL